MVNDNFVAVRLNAETPVIQFQGTTYRLNRTGEKGCNEVVKVLCPGDVAFPSLVFLDTDMNLIQAVQGYRSKEELMMNLEYLKGDYHKKLPWEKYVKMYNEEK